MPNKTEIAQQLREVDKVSLKVMEEMNIEVNEGDRKAKINISTTSLKEKIKQAIRLLIKDGEIEWKDSYRGNYQFFQYFHLNSMPYTRLIITNLILT